MKQVDQTSKKIYENILIIFCACTCHLFVQREVCIVKEFRSRQKLLMVLSGPQSASNVMDGVQERINTIKA